MEWPSWSDIGSTVLKIGSGILKSITGGGSNKGSNNQNNTNGAFTWETLGGLLGTGANLGLTYWALSEMSENAEIPEEQREQLRQMAAAAQQEMEYRGQDLSRQNEILNALTTENYLRPGGFNAERYLRDYTDVSDAINATAEQNYLNANPDVAAAIEAGTFGSGREHYDQFGSGEGRAYDTDPLDDALEHWNKYGRYEDRKGYNLDDKLMPTAYTATMEKSPFYDTYARNISEALRAETRQKAQIPAAIKDVLTADKRQRQRTPYGLFSEDTRRDENLFRMADLARRQLDIASDPLAKARAQTRAYLSDMAGLTTGASNALAQNTLTQGLNFAASDAARQNIVPSTVINMASQGLGYQNPYQPFNPYPLNNTFSRT